MSIGSRFFDGNPLKTLVWLIVVSIIVGFVFVTLGVDPIRLLRGVIANFDQLADSIVALFVWLLHNVGQYFIVGVVVVVPLWLLSRLIGRKGR